MGFLIIVHHIGKLQFAARKCNDKCLSRDIMAVENEKHTHTHVHTDDGRML